MKNIKLPLVVLLIAGFMLFVLGCGGFIDSENNSQNVQTQGQPEIQNTTVQRERNDIGEPVTGDGITVTLTAVTENTGSGFIKPSDGNVFVLCEFEIENDSDEQVVVSSVMSFETYCDDYKCSYSLSALMDTGDKNQLDGSVAPGMKLNGVVGYEVPEDWQELEIHFTPDVWSDNTIIFVARSG